MVSWVLAAVALYLIVRSPKPVAVGVFVLPVVLALVVVAGVWAPREDWAELGLERREPVLGDRPTGCFIWSARWPRAWPSPPG